METSLGVTPEKEISTASGTSTLIADIEEMRKNGDTRSSEFISKMKELEYILGVAQVTPFKTYSFEIFEGQLKEMTLSDMQRLAQRIGLNPMLERTRLKDSLIREFKASVKSSRFAAAPPPVASQIQLDETNPEYSKVRKILGDI